jgi:hypothetical protein
LDGFGVQDDFGEFDGFGDGLNEGSGQLQSPLFAHAIFLQCP